MGLFSLGVGVAVGYVLGSKNGGESLDRARRTASETWNDPTVQEQVNRASDVAARTAQDVAAGARKAADAAAEAVRTSAERVREAADADLADASPSAGSGGEDPGDPDSSPTTTAAGAEGGGDVVSDPGLSTEETGGDWADEGGRPAERGGTSA
ncbi:hypothetical protein [Nesterenkonia sp. F]|uniref:hypothetical protein n=1 Tax=Nesterenkonia sp. F TaxID=795955 RepID=UPI000255D566|nr:hypothetical protein [Nesterenkonia sp. F]